LLVVDAPTARTNGSIAGLVSVLVPLPSLPAATTTTMPACHACSTANISGSTVEDDMPLEPYERFSTRIGLAGSWLRFCTTQSIAAIIWDTSLAPVAVPTLTDVTFAFGDRPIVPVAGSLPTMMPAMCVPWPNVSR
jgi:hypothetical protein